MCLQNLSTLGKVGGNVATTNSKPHALLFKMPFPTCFSQDKSFTFNNWEWQTYIHNRLDKCILNSCYKWPANARFKVSTAVHLRIQVFWDLRQCHWVHFYLDSFTLRNKRLSASKMLETTQNHIPEDLHLICNIAMEAMTL
jgi:hypothetical protein